MSKKVKAEKPMTFDKKIKVAAAVRKLLRVLNPKGKYNYQTVVKDGTFALIVIQEPKK